MGVGVSRIREGCVGEVRAGGAEESLGGDAGEAREDSQEGTADRYFRCFCYPQQPSHLFSEAPRAFSQVVPFRKSLLSRAELQVPQRLRWV